MSTSGGTTKQSRGRLWVKLALAAGAAGTIGAAGLAVVWARGGPGPQEAPPAAATAAESAPPAPAPPPAPTRGYADRVVAYLWGNIAVSREELGEYLIARHGADKIDLLVNKRIIERACRNAGVEVSEAEINAAIADAVKGIPANRGEFIRQVLRQYHVNYYEWRQDVLRPKLMLTKLLRDRIRVDPADVAKAYESYYGPKVECQAIMFPADEGADKALARANEVYAKVRNDPKEFDRQASQQQSSALAASGGKLRPISHYGTGSEELEKVAFGLKPGDISPVLKIKEDKNKDCFVILRCVRHIPADKSQTLEEARPALELELLDRMVQAQVKTVLPELREQAKPHVFLKKPDPKELPDDYYLRPALPPDPGLRVVATIHGDEAITREELGEFLIERYGEDKLELLVNSRIIDRACREKGVTVSEEEISAAIREALQPVPEGSHRQFIEQTLAQAGMGLYEWRQDVLRPRLLMSKLIRDRVQVTDDEVKQAFECYYGPKVECQMILWPPGQERFIEKVYTKIRDSAEEFDRLARQQPNPRLAANGGKLPPLGRHSTGNEELEKALFSLKDGEVSAVIGTPEGRVVVKCLKHVPEDKSKKLADVRPALEQEVRERKLQVLIPVAFAELSKQAAPNLLLRRAMSGDDLKRTVERLLQETGDLPPPPRPDMTAPHAN